MEKENIVNRLGERTNLLKEKLQKETSGNRCIFEGTQDGASFRLCTINYKCEKCAYAQLLTDNKI